MATVELQHLPRRTSVVPSDVEGSIRDEIRSQDQGRQHPQEGELQEQEFSLPPADTGFRAWSFLAACFFVEALVWGVPFSYGLFQDFYTTHEPFKSEPNGVAAIGTTALGIMYLGSPICFASMQRWPLIRKWGTTTGLSLLVVSLLCASWASQVWHLVLTQGAMYAIGGSLLYSPIILFVDEWFIRRKGMAFGVMWAGTGFAGVCVPFVLSWLLEKYHFRTALRVWAVCLALITSPLLLVLRPRIPDSQRHQARKIDLVFLKNRTFLFTQLGNVLQGLGFFMPTIYLPTYARYLGIDSAVITATLALLNAATAVGCVFGGMLIDRWHVTTVIVIFTMGATFSVFVVWGLAVSIPVLCVFSVLYGFFGGGFAATYAGVTKAVIATHPGSDSGLILGFMAAGRGIGSIACGPLSESLIKTRAWEGRAGLGYGTGFGPLIIFTGVSSFLAGASFGARRLGWLGT